jgi:transketolase
MTAKAKAAHIGSSLSIIDILAVLYDGMKRMETEKLIDQKSVFVSKGHAAAGTYAVMAHAGLFPTDWLTTYCEDDSPLIGHVNRHGVPGVNLSTGSLGHALPFAAGKAFASKLDESGENYFVILSDGECDEGSNWEAALVSAHLQLSNLTVLVDRNRLQSLGSTELTISLEPFSAKWEAFGWDVEEIDGHNHEQIKMAALGDFGFRTKPKVIICNTIKGFGVSFMQNSVLWHYKSPTGEYLSRALDELEDRN